MTSIIARIFQTNTLCCLIPFSYLCLSLCPSLASTYTIGQILRCEANIPTTITFKCITQFAQSVVAGVPAMIFEYDLLQDLQCVYV
jgi:hypothetical protein